MTDTTKHKISSFATPTNRDMVFFDAMTPEEKRVVALGELEKSFKGKPVPFTKDLARQVFQKALDEASLRYVDN